MPNELVEIIDGAVLVNGDPLEEHYTTGTSNDMQVTVVDEKAYFV